MQFAPIDRRTADADLTVGCGYYALGCLMGVEPRSLKQYARSEMGILRPRGLSFDECSALIRAAGFEITGCPAYYGKTVAALLRERRPDRILVNVRHHWSGVRGGVLYDQVQKRRAKILGAYILRPA